MKQIRSHLLPLSVLTVLVLVMAVVGGVVWVRRDADPSGTSTTSATAELDRGESETEAEREAEEAAGGENASREMREALEQRPDLMDHRMPLAFVSEKLAQAGGGEASGEVLNGPSQEAYDQRALPRKVIANAQQRRAEKADHRAEVRANTAKGRRTLGKAVGSRRGAAANRWQSVGPDGGIQVEEASYTGKPAYVSGRTTALAVVGNTCTRSACTLLVGTAGGGLWKTGKALSNAPTWTAIGKNLPSTAIGSITLAGSRIYVGTGEPNGSSDNEAGKGLFVSTDGGSRFTKVSTLRKGSDFTLGRGVGAVVVDPADAKHLLIGTEVARHGASSINGGRFTPPGAAKVGLYETRNGGQTWTLTLSQDSDVVIPGTSNGADFFRGGISKVIFDPTHAKTVYATMFDYGLFRRNASGIWRQIYTIGTPGDPATSSTSRLEFATATLANGHTRIYLTDATYFDDAVMGLLRTDNATAAAPKWKSLSNAAHGTPGFGSYNMCGAQCYYDQVVSSPPGKPDEVFLSGYMQYGELLAFGGPGNSNGRAVVRSADAGVHFTDMTNDIEDNGLHPDHHALAFAPTPGVETFFTGSDGGVVRHNGPYRDRSSDCAARGLEGPLLADCEQFLSKIPTNNISLNKGLQTLQYQSVSVSPTGVVQGGTQDNGTWESDSGAFEETVGGDGGQSGFNVGDDSIRYHSYYAPQHDVSFTNGDPTGWDWISDPLLASGEGASFYTPFIADPVTPGTVFDGLQHVWRTLDNGGDRAYLDEHCSELTGDFSVTCGDWVPLGGARGDLSGGDPSNYVVAVERAATDPGTMWVGTRLGDIYVTTNADASDPETVGYTQISGGLPHRFPSGISIDPADAGHVFLSYSGYSAYSPGGHVFEVTVDTTTGDGSTTDLSTNLGDQPVTDIVYSPGTGSLLASTDFGVLTRTLSGAGSWVKTEGLPPVAVYGLTFDPSSGTLYAATHGRSIWKLAVG